VKRPAQRFHALAHADQPQPPPLAVLDVESPPFVGDVHVKIALVTPQPDRDPRRAAVFRGVEQTFLHHSIDAEIDLRGRVDGDPVEREVDRGLVGGGELLTVLLDRLHDAQRRDRRRVERVGEAVHGTGDRSGLGHERADARAMFRIH
jgi:hypothetical protein